MKSSNHSSNQMDKIIQVIAQENKKTVAFRRKVSASSDKKIELPEGAVYAIENVNQPIVTKTKENNEQPLELKGNNFKLPVINSKKINQFEKQNESKGELSLFKIDGKKINIELYSQNKMRPSEHQGIQDDSQTTENSKSVNPPIRTKASRSSSKNNESSIRNLKNHKNRLLLKGLNENYYNPDVEEKEKESEIVIKSAEKVFTGQRKMKAVIAKNEFSKKQLSLNKRQLIGYSTGNEDSPMVSTNQTQKKIQKEIKSNSISKTSHCLTNKRKYSISYWDFCLFLSLLNKVQALPISTGVYKAYVGKGNNSILIKNMIKNRFWWNIADSDADCNLYWLQNRDHKFLDSLQKSAKQLLEHQANGEGEVPEKQKFYLERPKEAGTKQNQRNQAIKEHSRTGFWKLISPEEQKKISKNPFLAEIQTTASFKKLDCANKIRVHNHFEFNWNITNKKALYYNLKAFYLAIKEDPFEYIPLTFHVQTEGDAEWQRFEEHFLEKQKGLAILKKQNKEGNKVGKKKKEKNLWIIKPGENSNQGCGIQVAETLEDIKQILRTKETLPNGRKRSHIIQRYLMPLLYCKRKFDIRSYVLVTSVNHIIKAYWYEEGYIRTSSKEFTLKNLKNRFIHLTNDAVQKKCEDYGKYQNGNKVSFNDFQKYLESAYPEKEWDFFETVYPKMMKLAADAIRSVHSVLDVNKRQFTFEVFGLDFMIDQEFNTWLIEVNNNPCLELGCPLLARIIPNMIENALKIAVDPFFPPPRQFAKNKTVGTQLFEGNKFTLIFNSQEEEEKLREFVGELKGANLSNIIESDDEEDNHDD